MADEPTGEQPQWRPQPSVDPQGWPAYPPPPSGYYPPPPSSYPPPGGYGVQPKKRKIWPWVLGGALGVFILFVGGCVAFLAVVGESLDSGDPTVKSPDGSIQAQPGAGAATSGPDFPGKRQDDTAAHAGDSVTIDDVTITTSPLFDRGQNSSLYLCTTVTIRNDSEESQSFNTWDWKLQDPAGTARKTSSTSSGNMLSSGELAAGGGTVEGDVCFDNPRGNAFGTFVVLFDPTFSFSSDRVAWINQR